MKSEQSWGRLVMRYKDTEVGIIPESWEVKQIKEVTEIVTDYVANGSFASLAENVKYKDEPDEAVLIRLVDYNNDFNGNFVFIDSHAYEFLGKSKLFGGEIIISNVGAKVGTVFRCPTLKYKMSLAPNSVMVKFKENDDFYFHWLRGYNGQSMLKSIVTGSAQPKFNKTNFREMLVPVPPVEEQTKIANILNSIDEKIDLNNGINKNLEEQIHALTNDMLSNPSSDWAEVSLNTIATFISGYSYKGKELTNSNIAMATIKNFNRTGGFKLGGYKEIIPSDKLKVTQHANLFDLLVAHTDLTQNAEVIGNAEMIMSTSGYSDIVFSMDLVKVLPKERISKFLLAALLQDKRFKAHCLGYVNGTTVLHLSKKALPEYSLLLPSDSSELKELDQVITSMYLTIANNIKENTELTNLRDSLLPKLMSGEIDVSDIDL